MATFSIMSLTIAITAFAFFGLAGNWDMISAAAMTIKLTVIPLSLR